MKTPNCFIDDCSLNISPIDSLPEVNDKVHENDNRNSGVIVISSEGEHSVNVAKNQNDSHFVPIPQHENRSHQEAPSNESTQAKQVWVQDTLCNRKRIDLPGIHHKGKCIN